MTIRILGGSDKGADLGGLEGSDRLCASLAQAAGFSGKTWRAYLSTQGTCRECAAKVRGRILRAWS